MMIVALLNRSNSKRIIARLTIEMGYELIVDKIEHEAGIAVDAG